MQEEKVIEFYDEFVRNQRKVSINDRIFSLYQRLLKQGMHAGSNVLELGCGIGTVSYLISKTVTQGKVESVDISPASIRFASEKINKPNTSFKAADVVKYCPDLDRIDYITLFDVIEHIPMDQHAELFSNISSYMTDQSQLLINIPSPESIRYDEKHRPELLQVIDQAIPFELLVENLYKNGLEIVQFETYSIWLEDDYQFFLIRKKKDFTNVSIASQRSFVQKVKNKLRQYKIRWMYPYK